MSFTWFEVVPVNELAPVPHVPDPCWSVHAIEISPVSGSTLMDG